MALEAHARDGVNRLITLASQWHTGVRCPISVSLMGVRAGLTEIPSDLFDSMVAGGESTFPYAARRSIDKAWHDFHTVFQGQGPPLSLAISGDCLQPQSPHSLSEFCEGNHNWYVGFASPALVNEVAQVLANLTSSDYKRWETEMTGKQYNCGETFFANLKAAYTEAAARKNALMIVIA